MPSWRRVVEECRFQFHSPYLLTDAAISIARTPSSSSKSSGLPGNKGLALVSVSDRYHVRREMEVESRSPDKALYLSFGRVPCLGFLNQPPSRAARRSDIDSESHRQSIWRFSIQLPSTDKVVSLWARRAPVSSSTIHQLQSPFPYRQQGCTHRGHRMQRRPARPQLHSCFPRHTAHQSSQLTERLTALLGWDLPSTSLL